MMVETGQGSTGTRPDGDAAIVIDGARKSYGPTAGGRAEAVAGVSLRVERGSVH